MMKKIPQTKFDGDGNVKRFIGTTVISFVHPNDLIFLNELAAWIRNTKPLFVRHYSILPTESFHVTIKNHSVCMNETESLFYERFISHFEQYVAMKERCSAFPLSHLEVKASKMDFSRSTCEIFVDFDEPTSRHVEYLRSQLVQLGSREEKGFRYHITLAYMFKLPEENEVKQLEQEKKEIAEKMGQLYEIRNYKIHLGPPKLCYFNDMTKFVPI